jgi:hypothetical protein
MIENRKIIFLDVDVGERTRRMLRGKKASFGER